MDDIKEYLAGGRKLDGEVHELSEARRRAYEILTLGSSLSEDDKVQTTKENSYEKNMAIYLDYTMRLEEAIGRLLSYKEKIAEIINAQEDSVYKAILVARYINCKNWEQIADDLHYNLRWVHRMHNRALEAIESHHRSVV